MQPRSTMPFRKRHPTSFLLLVVGGALLLLALVGSLARGTATTTASPAAATVTTTVTTTKTQPPAAQTRTVTATVTAQVPATGADGVTDGTYRVGPDILPGTYTTRGEAQEGGECYWARQSSSTGITAEHKGAGPQLVAIKPSDKYFRTEGCQPWTGASRP